MNYYYVIYKPFNVLSQFTSSDGKLTLHNFFDVPGDVYAVGRLDYDSEGLLILTNDRSLNKELLTPAHQHEKEYWVQVEGSVSKDAITRLCNGVTINVDGKMYKTGEAVVKQLINPKVPVRIPAIRVRKNIPDTWISIVIKEGKNRQVRKMTASVGFPTLRLIRYRIEKIIIDQLQPGDMKLLTQAEMYNLLNIHKK